MSKIVKHTEFRKVVDGLWTKVKENFITNITYDATSKKLKYTKNGREEEVTSIITRWKDLENVEEYEHSNLLDYDRKITGRTFDDNGVFSTDSRWSVYEFNVKPGTQYTIQRRIHDNNKYVYLNNDSLVRVETATAGASHSWHVHTITIPQDVNKVAMRFQHNLNPNDSIMITEGNQVVPTFVPYGGKIQIGTEVGIKFDSSNCPLGSSTVSGALEELSYRDWQDLSYVEKYESPNILDYSKVEVGKSIDSASGDITPTNSDWGIVEFPVVGGDEYTLLRKRNANVKIRFVNGAGAKVDFINQPISSPIGGWHRCVFNAHQDAVKGILEVKHNQGNEKETMILRGNQNDLFVDPNNPIKFSSDKVVVVGKEVALEFDNTDSNIKSTTVESAIKEVNNKIVNTGGTVTSVNNVDPVDGNVTIGIGNINGLQRQLDEKVVTVNQQPQQGGNVTLTGANIDATVGNNTTNIQEHLRRIGVIANNNDTRLIKLEQKHPTYNVGDIVPTFKNSNDTYRIDGCDFMYCGVAKSLNRTQYPDFCDVLGYPTNTSRYDTPVIRDETVVIGNGKSVTKRYYICIKNR